MNNIISNITSAWKTVMYYSQRKFSVWRLKARKRIDNSINHSIYLWKRLRFWTPTCNRQWRIEATRSVSPPSQLTRLLSNRTRCRPWCSHLYKQKQTHPGVTICLNITGEIQCCWSSNWAVIREEKKKCLKLFPSTRRCFESQVRK